MTIVALTGHRPNKLGGNSRNLVERTIDVAEAWLHRERPAKVISGMAMGWDMAGAQAALSLQIPLIAALPFREQVRLWPMAEQRRWEFICRRADVVETVSTLRNVDVRTAMDLRNRWMVDRCDVVLALWNGTPGGTGNCIRYAEKLQKPIVNLWDNFRFWNSPYRELL